MRVKRERGCLDMDVGEKGVSTGVGVGVVAVVMGVGAVVMCTVGVGMGGVYGTEYNVVTAALEVSCSTPLQIRSRRQRPGA